METLITILAIAALAAITVGQVCGMWSLWKDCLEKEQKRKQEAQGNITVETVCDECGSSLRLSGAYRFRGRYLCGKCWQRTVNSLKIGG